jgi:serine/threonine protein kinase
MTDRGEESPPGAGLAEAIEDEAAQDPLVVRARSRLGTMLHDKWRLDVLLGVGGMAAVYAATHRNGSRAAVKVLHPEMSTNPVVRERFLWEGYVANAVGHDGAVKVLDDDAEDDGGLFLITELLDGETLEERRVRLGGHLPAEEVLFLADKLLDVLAAAHAKGIIHRDLKPENVFLTRAGNVKVLDFGIARLRELSTAKSLTQSGTMIGTPAYMAPEHARGLSNDVDERSDLWSCGAMMFCLLSGRNVHEGRTVNEQLVNAITRPAPSLAAVAPTVPSGIVRVVDRALEFAKDMRWADASTMQEGVRNAYLETFGRPLSQQSAPSLGGLPDRTLAHASESVSLSVPTTARPVAASYWPAPMQGWTQRARWLAIGSAVAFGFLSTTLVWTFARGRGRAAADPSAIVALPASAPAFPAQSVILVVPSGPPEVAVTDLPVAESAAKAAHPPGKKAASSAAAAASAKAACDPPYTVDSATGKRHWKVECL